VRLIREDLPRLGGRKLLILLQKDGHDIGRDRLFDLLRDSGMLVKRHRSRTVTTNSRHWMKKWPNLIREVEPSRPDEVWVSDITYIEVMRESTKNFLYLSLVTDAFTHEIVGYALHDSLDTTGPLRALNMALSKYPSGTLRGLIHHSDRGCQYCSLEYVSKLQEQGILISMTENGDPYENAVAERVNGILKTEWLYQMTLESSHQAQMAIDRIVYLYNNVRPHESVGNMTPAASRKASYPPKKLWKNYWRMRRQSPMTG
jgi:transposase InsO family protein